MVQGRFGAGFLAVLLLALALQPGQATEQQRRDQDSEQRDGQSRNETGPLSVIPLTTGDGSYRIRRIVLIQTRFLHVASTENFGVEYTNLDKVDLGEVPLLGQLFSREISADDLSEATRVGASYIAGDDTLAAVVEDDVDVGRMRISVVNGKGSYQIMLEPKILEVAPDNLDAFGEVPTVREILTQVTVPDGTTVVLGGLTRDSVPEVDSKLPVVGDIPVLQQLFRGTVHEQDEANLLILIKPSILVQGED